MNQEKNNPRFIERGQKILLFANSDWYLYNFRLPLAAAIRAMGCDVVLVSPPGEYTSRLAAAGFRCIPFSMNRSGMNPLIELWMILRLIRLYWRERPYLVHHFTVKCVLYGSIAATLTHVPARINAITGLGHLFTDEAWRTRMARRLVSFFYVAIFRSRVNRTTFENPDDYRMFIDKGLMNAASARLIPSAGVDTHKFTPRLRNPSSKIKVLMATRLLWEKGVGEYIEAARFCLARNENVEFWLAGARDPGNPASVSEHDINAWRETDAVVVLGHVDNMVELLHQVDIVVLPSYREGTPNVLLEAAACELPIVATDVPGCRAVVAHSVNGFLVPPRDSRALAVAIERLLNDPDERKRMGKAGRAKVLTQFDQELVLSKTLEVYRELINSPMARPS